MKRKFTSLKRLSSLFSSTEQKHGPSQHVNRSALTEHTQTCLDASKTSIGQSMPPSSTYMEISRLCHKRSSFAGHYHRVTEEMIHHVLLWRPRGHVRYRGLTYPDTISTDACMEKEDLPEAMADREVWRQVVAVWWS